MKTFEEIEAIIRARIEQLNTVDKEACSKRWDNLQPQTIRMYNREISNQVTFARQELEDLLQQFELPRFKQPENEKDDIPGS